MRITGLQALDLFADESIDILHVDGNHTENVALNDAKQYLPKVKKEGIFGWMIPIGQRNFPQEIFCY